MSEDPFASYLQRADAHFRAGEVVAAGQIWQAILKRDPQHAAAREGLLKVKEALARARAAEAAPAPEPVPRPDVGPDTVDMMVRQGCTLYDMGQSEDALQKWEEALALAPEHPLLPQYIQSARKDLGLAPGESAPAPPAPTAVAVPTVASAAPGADLETLLRQAAQLYDMGVIDEAIAKWERVLELDPENADARTYLDLAAKDQRAAEEQATTRMARAPIPVPESARQAPTVAMPGFAPPAPEPPPVGATMALPMLSSGGLDPQLAKAEHLLEIGRREEAAFFFQLALNNDPSNPRAREGLDLARPRRAPEGTLLLAAPAAPAEAPPAPVPVPAALTAPQPRRSGLEIPPALQDLAAQPWLRSPLVLGGSVAAFLLGFIGITTYRGIQRDRRLQADVSSAKVAALGPVARATAVVEIRESDASILAEGQSILAEDPVRAYHRAKELLRRNPNDGPGAQLLEKAKAALGAPAVTADLATLDAKLRTGDFEAANRQLDELLRTQPEDPVLLRRAARLLATLAQLKAAKHNLREAREALERGRALFPQDRSWSLRLRLLDRIEGQPKEEQPGWIALLG